MVGKIRKHRCIDNNIDVSPPLLHSRFGVEVRMNIINLVDVPSKTESFHSYNSSSVASLVIDNGSYKCKVGWSSNVTPLLVFRNLISRPRKDRRKDVTESLINKTVQVGNNIVNIEAMRFNLKTQFDRNVVTHVHNQEQILDYIFNHLSVDQESSFQHPILLTEALGNPNYFRQQMNELLFECYSVPGVCYGIDSLFSWQGSDIGCDALVLSFGYNTTHVIPVLAGRTQMDRIRRINIGGFHITTYLHRLMQMKYPTHLNAITISRMEALLHCHSSIALDYQEQLKNWADCEYYTQNVKKIQLAFTPVVQSAGSSLDLKIEKRKEPARRLLEFNARRLKDRQLEDECQLQSLYSVRALFEQGEVERFEVLLKENNFATLETLDRQISVVQERIKQADLKLQEPSGAHNRPIKDKSDGISKPPFDIPLEQWVSDVKDKRNEILRRKEVRKARRQEAVKRHTAAAQKRMRIISLLAHNDKGVDNFGINDNDWDVYKVINRENESDSEDDNEKLIECDNILRQHDPVFKDRFPQPTDAAENYQLHFSVESIRAPELFFQPSMIGSAEMGLAELIGFVLKLFSESEQQRLVNNIFITGGCAHFAGLEERLSKELNKIRPFQTTHRIFKTKSPELGAWLGARDFANSNEFHNYLTTKKDYEEKGSEYFKTHTASNNYTPFPFQN